MRLKPILLCGLLLGALCAVFAAVPPELLQMPLPQDSAILSGQLENGLSYYIMRNPKPEKIAELRLIVSAGAVNEDDDQRGLAHFTEHMAFNGTEHFAKSELVQYLSSIGVGYYNGLNGGTMYDNTMYTFKIPADDKKKLRQGVLILADMAARINFEDTDIEHERGVIIEEWRMGRDAQQRVSDAQNAVLFAGSRYAERSPIGTYEVLSTFKPEVLKRFYRDWYRPDLQTVVIVGDIDPQEMLGLVQENFASLPAREKPRPREDFLVPDYLVPQAVVATDKEYPENSLTVLWKKPVQKVQTLGQYEEDLKRDLFYTMLNTRLEEHSKTEDPPYSGCWAFETQMLRTMSVAMVSAEFTSGKAEQALQTILTEARRIQRDGFLASEFDRAKLELKRQAERQVADKDTRQSDMLAWRLMFSVMNGAVFMDPEENLQLLTALLDEVSLDDVNAVGAQLIQDKNMCITLGAPAREGTVYPTRERLLEIAQAVKSLEIPPYEDKSVNEPIMTAIPPAKPVVKESWDPASGVRKWILANGVTVYSKKTDFKNDEVLLGAHSPGGFCRYPEKDIPAANLVTDYISEGGFGNFDSVALGKATAGKVARVDLTLDIRTEGFNASCSPQDLELMFQMIHQYGTNARFNEADFNSFLKRTKSSLASMKLDPTFTFTDTLVDVRYNDNPYAKNLASLNLDGVKLADIERIYRDRFGNYSDFTFAVVGNFDEALLKKYCCTYLANLPARQRIDRTVDIGLIPVQGKKVVRFQKGDTASSYVDHLTNGNYSYSEKNEVLLDALAYVMNEKLRENIREERSGVYMIYSNSNTTNYPKQIFELDTILACSPDRVDELNDAIFATLDSLRAGYIDDRYLVACKATLKQRYAESIKSNRYWLGQFQNNLRQSRPLTAFLNEPVQVEKLNKKELIKAARKYLNYNKNSISVIMLPESTGGG